MSVHSKRIGNPERALWRLKIVQVRTAVCMVISANLAFLFLKLVMRDDAINPHRALVLGNGLQL